MAPPRAGSTSLNPAAGLTMTPVPVGATPPGFVVVRPPLGICISIAVTRFGAGTAGIEYEDVVDCPARGSPMLSSQRKPANELAPSTSVAQKERILLLWAKVAAP